MDKNYKINHCSSILNRILPFVLITMLSVSCGYRRINRELAPMDVINAHVMIEDRDGLFADLLRYPEYSHVIDSLVINVVGCSDQSYNKIVEYAYIADGDSLLTQYLGELIVKKQSEVLNEISDMSLENVGDYYRTHSSDYPFLTDVVDSAYFSNVDTLDYYSLKHLYGAFKDTDFESKVYPQYEEVRNSWLKVINEDLENYFTQEETILDAVEYRVRDKIERYIEKGVDKIIVEFEDKLDRGFFTRLFKHDTKDDYSIYEYARILVSQNLDPNYISTSVNNELLEFISVSTKLREEYICSLQDDYATCQDYYISDTISVSQPFDKSISASDASRIQNMRFMGNLLSAASFALAFTPYGWISAIADAADLINGMSEPSREQEMIESFVSNLYLEATEGVDDYLTKVFEALEHERFETESYIRNRINEEF